MTERLRCGKIAGVALLCLAIAILVIVGKPNLPNAFADPTKEYSGLPTEKWVGKYCYTVRNTIQNPQADMFCVITRAKSTTYTIPANYIKIRARAATDARKLVKTGSWKWKPKTPVHEECWEHFVLIDERKICSYGQMQPKNGTALTGVITPPASPART